MFGYALYKGGKHTKLSYPLEHFHPDVAGRGFHYGRFIQRLREKAASLSKYSFLLPSKDHHFNLSTTYLHPFSSFFLFSIRLEQGTVTSLIEHDGTIKGVQYKNKTGEELTAYAPLTIVCDGCFSNLRQSLCNPKVKMLHQTYQVTVTLQPVAKSSFSPFPWQVAVPSSFVGLILENSPLPYTNHGHVILADPSPVLFYPISSSEIRCLVDVPGQKVPSISSGEMAHYLKTTVAPQVRNTALLHEVEDLSCYLLDAAASHFRSPLSCIMPSYLQ